MTVPYLLIIEAVVWIVVRCSKSRLIKITLRAGGPAKARLVDYVYGGVVGA